MADLFDMELNRNDGGTLPGNNDDNDSAGQIMIGGDAGFAYE
jgi:hypothetical protein